MIRTLKDKCLHRHRFETLQHASRVIADWIGWYNNWRPRQALKMKAPAETYALVALPVRKMLGKYNLNLLNASCRK